MLLSESYVMLLLIVCCIFFLLILLFFFYFFFFQAEDGIRDVAVTGVQTCALPIFLEGFEKIFDALDQILKIIRASEGKADAAQKIMAKFKLDEEQTDAILELKIGRASCRERV